MEGGSFTPKAVFRQEIACGVESSRSVDSYAHTYKRSDIEHYSLINIPHFKQFIYCVCVPAYFFFFLLFCVLMIIRIDNIIWP